MNKKVKILVAAHKADPNIRQDDVYMPIQVGKALHPELDLGFQGDDTGDNISEKNGSYCELTALYWAWKNLRDVDIIGLAHYRRYFAGDIKKYIPFVEKGGVVLPRPFHCRYDNFTNLALLLTQEEAILSIDLLLNKLPDSKNIVKKYFWQSNKYSVFNMFLMRWNEFKEFCEFLFPYLEELEEKLQAHNYARLKRNIGYIAEALWGFWVMYKKLRIKYIAVNDYSSSLHNATLRTKLRELQRDLGFKMLFFPSRQNISYYPAAVSSLSSQGYVIKKN